MSCAREHRTVSDRWLQSIRCAVLMALALWMTTSASPSEPWAAQSGCGGPCWSPSGLFPDPTDCCGFYSCASCRAYRLRCAPGTVFDRRLGLCNHPHDAPACLAPNPGCYLYYLSSSFIGKK